MMMSCDDSDRKSWLPDDLVMNEIISKLPINCLIKLRYEVSEPNSFTIFRFIIRTLFGGDDDHDDGLSGVIVKILDKKILKNHNDYINHFFYLSSTTNNDNNGDDDDDKLQLRFSMTPDYPYDPSSIDPYPMIHYCVNTILGSVNGIVVLTEGESFGDGFWMWDPSDDSYEMTAPCITPKPYLDYRASPCFDCFEGYEYFGCGYCARSNALKVVSIRSFAYILDESDLDESESDVGEEFSDANDAFLDMGVDDWEESKDFSDASDDFVDSRSDLEAKDDNIEQSDPVRDLNLQPDFVVEVYSLSSNSWRRIEVDAQLFSQFPHTSLFYPQLGYTSDTFSWLVFSYEEDDSGVIIKLLTFHMLTEMFQVTSLPDPILGYYEMQYGQRQSPIQLSNGTIALVIPNLERSFFDVWLLLEDGVMDSWTRLCTIGPFPEVGQILGFWKNGKVFMESTNGELVLADLITNKILQNLPIEGCPCYSQIIHHKGNGFVLKEDHLVRDGNSVNLGMHL